MCGDRDNSPMRRGVRVAGPRVPTCTFDSHRGRGTLGHRARRHQPGRQAPRRWRPGSFSRYGRSASAGQLRPQHARSAGGHLYNWRHPLDPATPGTGTSPWPCSRTPGSLPPLPSPLAGDGAGEVGHLRAPAIHASSMAGFDLLQMISAKAITWSTVRNRHGTRLVMPVRRRALGRVSPTGRAGRCRLCRIFVAGRAVRPPAGPGRRRPAVRGRRASGR
jgi:hypothetical protein